MGAMSVLVCGVQLCVDEQGWHHGRQLGGVGVRVEVGVRRVRGAIGVEGRGAGTGAGCGVLVCWRCRVGQGQAGQRRHGDEWRCAGP